MTWSDKDQPTYISSHQPTYLYLHRRTPFRRLTIKSNTGQHLQFLQRLSSLVYSCLYKVYKGGPPIYSMTSPRVSFVGEVFYSSSPFKEHQFPFFHPKLPCWVSKGDTSGRLSLSSIETLPVHHKFSCQKPA